MSATEVVVRCPDFSKTFATREAAERWAAHVVEFGHCHHEHIIEEWTDIGARRRFEHESERCARFPLADG